MLLKLAALYLSSCRIRHCRSWRRDSSDEQLQDIPERGTFPGKSRSISSHLLTTTGPAPESNYEHIKGFPHKALCKMRLWQRPVMTVGLAVLRFVHLISLTPSFLQFRPLPPILIPIFLAVRFSNTLCRQQPSWFIVFRLHFSYVVTLQRAFCLGTSKEKKEATVIRIYAHSWRRVHWRPRERASASFGASWYDHDVRKRNFSL
jgi:hypothetical protein